MTFAEKRAELLGYLRQHGWRVEEKSARAPWGPLKVPRATHVASGAVLSFRSQAVYLGEHSLVSDMRETSGADLARAALQRGSR